MTTTANWEEPTRAPLVTSCKQAARLVSISFERRLSLRDWFSMRAHLLMCKTCTFYGRQIKALCAIFARHEEVLANTPASVDEKLDDKVRQRIKDAMGHCA